MSIVGRFYRNPAKTQVERARFGSTTGWGWDWCIERLVEYTDDDHFKVHHDYTEIDAFVDDLYAELEDGDAVVAEVVRYVEGDEHGIIGTFQINTKPREGQEPWLLEWTCDDSKVHINFTEDSFVGVSPFELDIGDLIVYKIRRATDEEAAAIIDPPVKELTC